MQLIISADDYGLSEGITINILNAFDHGALSSTSMIANGRAFDHAMDEYKKRSGLRLSIHLNFIEGSPVLPAEQVPLLVDDSGNFCHTFLSLWRQYLTSNRQYCHALKDQIQQEMTAQILKIAQCFDSTFQINIDSHLHLHMVPFVFDALLELHNQFSFSYVRLPQERLFLVEGRTESLKTYCSLSPVKNRLLNVLSKMYQAQLSARHIAHSHYFVGILFSGKMTESVVRSALSRINPAEAGKITEILFHPGQALESEKGLRVKHYSPWRQREYEAVKSESFQNFVRTLQSN
ncbi:MAG: ChbG/HpnK family deacetylase [SAR324 cluster bacterium]|nr:ChbG/HpnK family deacetylase [SAR324 cluster bacterium]